MHRKQISDEVLLHRLSESRDAENEVVTSILKDLLEVESRGLHLARGYSSMYKFCLRHLKYSEFEATIRINAMRLMRSVPEVENKIETGALTLSVAAEVGRQIRKEEKRIKEPLKKTEKLKLIASVENASSRECERTLARVLPEIQEVARESTKPLRDENTLISFVASPALFKKLERLKNLLSHKNHSGRYDLLFEELADIALKKLDPLSTENDTANNARLPRASMAVVRKSEIRSRAIRVSVKREVIRRAHGQCEYVDPVTGRRCGSEFALQIDHITRFADGGANTLDNLRVLCGAHNRWREKYPSSLFDTVLRGETSPLKG